MNLLRNTIGAGPAGLGLLAALLVLAPAHAGAQARCTVADFKRTAALLHDPTQREAAIKTWLNTSGPACNEAQLKVILSNAPSWLGTAYSPEVAAIIDGIHERRMINDGAKITEYYMSGNRAAGAPPAPPASAPAPGGAAAGAGARAAMPPPPPPMPAPGQAGAVLQSPAQAGAVPQPPGQAAFAPPVQAVAQPPRPLPDDPAQRDRLTRFSSGQRQALQQYFDEQRKDQECPAFTRNQGGRCVSARVGAKPWQLGSPLDNSAPISEPPVALIERIGRAPVGYRYLQVQEDVLLVNERSMVVVDMILDLGGVAAKGKAADSGKT